MLNDANASEFKKVYLATAIQICASPLMDYALS